MNGFVIYAKNSNINYKNIALYNLKKIKLLTNNKTCLITDSLEEYNIKKIKKYVDEIIYIDFDKPNKRFINNETVNFYNLDRLNTYELSPFKNTVLLDADYFIMNSNIKNIFQNKFICHTKCKDILTNKINDPYCSLHGPIMYWGTLLYYKKDNFSKDLWNLFKEIYNNYEYYRLIYNLPTITIRFDFIISIAFLLLNFKPYNFYNELLSTNEKITKLNNSIFINDYEISNTNIHLLNKTNLDILCQSDIF